MINGYLLEFDRVRRSASARGHFTYEFEQRSKLVRKFAWAIPNREAIDAIVSLGSPIVEMGAGTGYWAALLRARGVSVDAFDISPPSSGGRNNHYHPCVSTWSRVLHGSVEKLSLPRLALGSRGVRNFRGADRRALMLCWPPYSDSMASDALKAFRGDRVVYIGEGGGGCTGDDAFHELLERNWLYERDVNIPQWDGIHDYLMIYRRKRPAYSERKLRSKVITRGT